MTACFSTFIFLLHKSYCSHGSFNSHWCSSSSAWVFKLSIIHWSADSLLQYEVPWIKLIWGIWRQSQHLELFMLKPFTIFLQGVHFPAERDHKEHWCHEEVHLVCSNIYVGGNKPNVVRQLIYPTPLSVISAIHFTDQWFFNVVADHCI